MMLGKIKSAVERADHFEMDDGSGRPFKVAKAALSPALADKVRRLYCGGKVQRFAEGGEVTDTDVSTSVDTGQGVVPLPPANESTANESTDAAQGSTVKKKNIRPDLTSGIRPNLAAEYAAGGKEMADQIKAEAAAAPAPVPADGLGVAQVPSPVGQKPVFRVTADAPVVPPQPAMPAFGEEAARRVADAGVLAQQALRERQTAEAQARAAEYNAAAALVATQDEATRRAEAEAARMREVYQRGESAIRLQKERLAAREKDLLDPEAMRIETRRVFSKIDPVGLIVGAMMAGAAEAGLGKGSGTEVVLKTVNDAIDRDVLAQKVEKEGLRSSRLQAYQSAVGDIGNAGQLLKADQQLAAAAQARLEAQMTQSAQGRIMLNKLASDLSSQARKTAEEAVNLITGQAMAQQKAKMDAESHVLNLRKAEADIAQGAAQLRLAEEASQRKDEELSLARQQLGLAMSKEDREAAAQRAALGVAAAKQQIARKGMVGQGITPEEYMNLPDEKERQLYVTTTDPTSGVLTYRRAKSEKDAEKFKDVSSAFERAIGIATELDKLIAKSPSDEYPTGYAPDRIAPGTAAKGRSEALQQQLKFVIKDMEELGAITKSDAELMEPLIPDPQGVFSTDAAEAARMNELIEQFQTVMELKSKQYLTTRPGQKARGVR